LRKPQINHRVKNGSLSINLDFRSCRPVQIRGKAIWNLVDCTMRLPFKVSVGDMELQPRMVVKIWLKGTGVSALRHLARQAANLAEHPVHAPE
jgi:hypothetical protein